MNILLACAAGMSTSMLVQRMKESANQEGIELEIDAVPVGFLKDRIEGVQLILLGPQVSYMENDIAAEHPSIPVQTVNMMDYGMMNGKKVLADAINTIKEWEAR